MIKTTNQTNEFNNNKACKKLVNSIIFIVLFCILWHYCFSVLWIEKTPLAYFYDEPENSMDIIYIGSSNTFVHFNTTLAYYLYGYTTGMMSTSTQPFVAIEYIIKESKNKQKPSLYIIDIARLVDDLDSFPENGIRNVIDSMKFSKNRIDVVNKLLKYAKIDESEYVNYYFSFLMYHNIWKNIKNQNFGNTSLYKGYIMESVHTEIVPQSEFKWQNDIIELQEENKKVLISLINYIKDNNLNVLFVIPARGYDEISNGRLNDATSIIDEYGMNIINFNTLNDYRTDFSTDLYNEAHLNVYGATKYTLYFAKYLKENYNLIDHRDDNRYKSWKEEYERFKQDFKKLTNKNYEDILLEYK